MGAKLTMLFNLIRNWVAKTAAVAGAQPAPVEQPAVGLDAEPLRHARALSEAGNVAAARRIYEEVLRRDRENSEAQYYLGVLLGRTGRLAAASELLQQVVTKDPQFTGALNALGNVRRLQGQPNDAEGYYRRVLAIEAGTASVWVNLGLCLRDSGRNQDAVDALQRALQLKPDDPDAIVNLALVRNDLGESAEAQALLCRALELDPNMAEAHVELAQILLRRGEFAAGWSEYDWRLRMEKWEYLPKYSCPVWRGEDLKGKTLLVTAEQGLGDQIMFASCLPEVVQAAGQCIVESHSRLAALFQRSFPEISVSPRRFRDSAAVHEGVWLGLQDRDQSLPGLLRRHESDFPRHAAICARIRARRALAQAVRARGAGPTLEFHGAAALPMRRTTR
jgi:Flp pilus assembly protein TadD